VSFTVLGGCLGAILAGGITGKLGRKYSIVLSCLLIIFGSLLLVFTNTVNMYCMWRIIIGFGMGLNMMAC